MIAESAFNDPTGTVLALTVAGVVQAGNVGATEPLVDFSKSLALGAVLGVGAGLVLAAMLSSHVVGIWRESPAVAILALVALTYFTTDELGGSAYLAAFVMGLIVGNMERLGLGRQPDHATQLDDFMAHVSELAVLAVFVTLGINLPLDALWDNLWGGLVLMAVFLFVARPLTVLACLLPDRRGQWTREEIVFLSWCRETGVVPAAVAGVLLAREVEGAELVAAMVALAVVTTRSWSRLRRQAHWPAASISSRRRSTSASSRRPPSARSERGDAPSPSAASARFCQSGCFAQHPGHVHTLASGRRDGRRSPRRERRHPPARRSRGGRAPACGYRARNGDRAP